MKNLVAPLTGGATYFVTTMKHIITQIYLPDGNHYFLLSEIPSAKGQRFMVTTVKNADNIYFEVLCNDKRECKLIGPVPEWIEQLKDRIINVITIHLDNPDN